MVRVKVSQYSEQIQYQKEIVNQCNLFQWTTLDNYMLLLELHQARKGRTHSHSSISIAPHKVYLDIFFLFLHETYVVGIHSSEAPGQALLMSKSCTNE